LQHPSPSHSQPSKAPKRKLQTRQDQDHGDNGNARTGSNAAVGGAAWGKGGGAAAAAMVGLNNMASELGAVAVAGDGDPTAGSRKRVRVQASVSMLGNLAQTDRGWELQIDVAHGGVTLPMLLSDAVLQPIIGWSTRRFTQQRKAGKKDAAIKEAVKTTMTKASDAISKKWAIASAGTYTVERVVPASATKDVKTTPQYAVVEFESLSRKPNKKP
jgi:hypothetical protein